MITTPTQAEIDMPVKYTYNRDDRFDSDGEVTVSQPGMITNISENTLKVEGTKRTVKIDLTKNTITVTDHNLFKNPDDETYELNALRKLTKEAAYFDTEDFDDEDEVLGGLEQSINRANNTIDLITNELGEKWLIDAKWITKYDLIRAHKIWTNTISNHITEHNLNTPDQPNRITFPSEQGVIIWTQEILGQLSDGIWENAGIDWQQYHNLEIELDPSAEQINTTGNFEQPLQFKEKLTEFSGQTARMLFYANVAYRQRKTTIDDLEAILSQLDNLTQQSTKPL